jgi:predicted O-methyltransferase YrrM
VVSVREAKESTVTFLKTTDARVIAEIGVYKGYTSREIAAWLNGQGELHLFDFDDHVGVVGRQLRQMGFSNIIEHANSRRMLDSYNWSLKRLLDEHPEPFFDYVFIDGAHTWAHDALAFLLVDRLLKVGGYVDFDDYEWTLAESPTLNPGVFPATRRQYSDEQIACRQVAAIVELLVRRGGRYEEVLPDQIFRKTCP